MRRLFNLLFTFSALFLFCAAAQQPPSREAEPKLPTPCDEAVRKDLYGRFLENYKGNPEQKSEAYKAAKEYVCRCDELREQLSKSLLERGRERFEGGERAGQDFETAKKFLSICGDTRRPFDRYLRDWVSKYGGVVREFEEKKRQDGEPAAKGPEKEQ